MDAGKFVRMWHRSTFPRPKKGKRESHRTSLQKEMPTTDDFETIPNSAQVPDKVYNQLSKEFLPAVKVAATAGSELLRCYQALDKASEAYAKSLDGLVQSSKTAGPRAREHGLELQKIVVDYRKQLERHKPCVREFTGLVAKVVTYSNEEKDNLKTLHSKHQKEEKDLQKAVKKGTKKASDVEAFNQTAAHDFYRQQEMRYKFFSDRHRRWLKTYSDLLEVTEKPHNQVNGTGERSPTVESIVAPSVHRSTVNHGETEAIALVPPITEVTVTPPEDSHHDHHHEENGHFNGGLNMGADSPRTSRATSLESLDPLPDKAHDTTGVVLINQAKRDSLDVKKVNSTVMTTSTAVQAQVPEVAPRPVPLPREERPVYTERNEYKPPQAQDYYVGYDAISPPVKGRYTGPVIQPAPVPRQREPEIVRPRATDIQESQAALHVDTYSYTAPRPDPARMYAPPPQERPHYHVESEYNPAVSPAHRPASPIPPKRQDVVVPAAFNASDYGRILTVTQDFNATSGEQITVNRGDRIILIKSGSRGWIFIQDQATQRTGWIPAPYVSY